MDKNLISNTRFKLVMFLMLLLDTLVSWAQPGLQNKPALPSPQQV